MSIVIHHILVSAEIVDDQKRTPVQISFTQEEETNPKAPGSVHEMFRWAKLYIFHNIVDKLPALDQPPPSPLGEGPVDDSTRRGVSSEAERPL